MRRIVIWLASTVTVVVLLFGYHTSTDKTSAGTPTASASSPATASQPSTSTASPTTSSPATSSPAPSSTSAGSSASAGGTGSAKSVSYTGSVAQTRWGPVQVEITVKAGKVTDVTVLQQPDGNPRDVEINDRALPTLIAETKAASSADIDMVSGATVTSDGYLESLQAALDKAGI
jgi:uncharacterized protein with FMN-binding domain